MLPSSPPPSLLPQVQQHSVQPFLDQHSGTVAGALIHTAQKVVGMLPPQYFEVTINAVGGWLAGWLAGWECVE